MDGWRVLAGRFGQAWRGRSRLASADDDPLREAGAVAFIAWLVICLALAASALAAAVSPWQYYLAAVEDGVIENLTVAAYVLAALALSAAAYGRQGFPRLALAALAVGMAVLAGEEISWGQRLLGYATPDFLSQNTQGEANLHNVPGVFGGGSVSALMMLPCVLAVAGALSGKGALFGVPLPSLPLALGALAAVMWPDNPGTLQSDLSFWLALPTEGRSALLLTLGVYAAFVGRWHVLLAAAATLALCAAFGYLDHSDWPRWNELQELLFGLFWLGYAAELWLGRAPLAGRFPVPRGAWPLAGWGVLALGVGLAAFEGLSARQARAAHGPAMLEEARRLAESAAPAARSTFDVYLRPGEVAYFKRPCSQADIGEMFFLHVFPQDPADLPLTRRWFSGFVNLDFRFHWHGALAGRACGAVVPLPDYPIERVRTGVWNFKEELWQVQLR